MLSRQNCGEIMTQNLCSKQETLLQLEEEDLLAFHVLRKLRDVQCPFNTSSMAAKVSYLMLRIVGDIAGDF